MAGIGFELRRLGRRPLAVAGLTVATLFVLMALFAPLIAPYDPADTNFSAVLEPPSSAHIMGTDDLGRDVFSRVVYGARASLEAGVLATLATGPAGSFDLTYIHSVTRTPVVETYRVEADALVQTSIAFDSHGPGLPTQPDAGETWREVDGRFVVSMARRFERIRMRVHRDQSPQLHITGGTIDLAQWGNRAIELHTVTCAAG